MRTRLISIACLLSLTACYPPFTPLTPRPLTTSYDPIAPRATLTADSLSLASCYAHENQLSASAYDDRKKASNVSLLSAIVATAGGAYASFAGGSTNKTVGGVVGLVGGILGLFKSQFTSDPEGVQRRAAKADSAWASVLTPALAYEANAAAWKSAYDTYQSTPKPGEAGKLNPIKATWLLSETALKSATSTCGLAIQ